MSKKNLPAAKTATTSIRFDAYAIREYDVAGEKKSEWTRLGVAFQHSDGNGFNVLLTAFPLDGKMVLRLHEPKEASAE